MFQLYITCSLNLQARIRLAVHLISVPVCLVVRREAFLT